MPESKQAMFKTPRLARRFLRWFCDQKLVEEIEGDLEEYYLIYREKNPAWKAKIYYWYHLISFIRPYSLKKKSQNSNFSIMFNNYIKFSIRYFSKHKANLLLNVTSLSIGIACFLFIFIYLEGETSYDAYHEGAEHIHRVTIDFVNEGERIPDATTPPALMPALRDNLPEVAFATRIYPTWGSKFLIGADQDRQFYEEQIYRVDPDFLKIFNYKVIMGNPDELLGDPANIVLTQRTAKKYFGDENPIGQELTIFNRDNRKKIVSGVIADVPFNSHFTFDFLTPLHFENRNIDEMWGWYNYYTYVKLHEGADWSAFEAKLQPLYLENNPGDTINANIMYSQAVKDIHLTSALKWELGANGSMSNIRIFVAIGLFILIISMINYLNLTIGGLVKRAKEVGVRKSFGAARSNLIGQFVVESLIVIVISLMIGGLLAEMALVEMSDLFGRQISLIDSENVKTYFMLSLGALSFGLLAGIYPALHFASLGEIKVMLNNRKGGFLELKNGLLVVQFTISVIMIVGTMVVYQQLMYFKSSDMGFEMDQVLVIENADVIANQITLGTQVEQLSFVESAGFTTGVVGRLNWTFMLGYPDAFLMNYAVVTPAYLDAMQFELIAGRNFDESIESDGQGLNFIVNEAALKALKIDMDQVGTSVVMSNEEDSLIYGKVLGVVKDFHYSNFKSEIKPYAFFYRDEPAQNLVVRITGNNYDQHIKELEDIWNDLAVGVPFESYFLDQSFGKLHRSEESLAQVLLYLTILSIFIAFMGMLAITNIVIKNRLKEIAVRKVLGASVSQVVNMVTRNFILLVLVANAIGLPIAYLLMDEWISDFTYRMTMSPGLFLIAASITIGLAYLIVGLRSYRAANSGLTSRLRDE